MHDDFVKEEKVIEKTEFEKEVELIKSIIKTKEELIVNDKNFEYAKGDLIDYYTYKIKADQAKLDYLIKLAKSKGIEVDMISNIKYKFFNEEDEAV